MQIPILVTLDENYIPQLKVLLLSMNLNNMNQKFDIYLLHSRIPSDVLDELEQYIAKLNFRLITIKADDQIFDDAKVTDRYPKEMYYRLLAAKWLPEKLDKILYLDPDILNINPLKELWEKDIDNYLFAAASHVGKLDVVNKVRLKNNNDYYNSGVLLINLKKAREMIVPQEIFDFVEHHHAELLLPDQDVMNAMYGGYILEISDRKWNYDARNYNNYLLKTAGEYDINQVMDHTALLHFCGRAKPWKQKCQSRFAVLYKHYMRLAERLSL